MPLLLNHTIQGINQIRFSFRDKVQNYSFKKGQLFQRPWQNSRYKVRLPEMPISIVGKHIFRNIELVLSVDRVRTPVRAAISWQRLAWIE